jgi:hypothetical protein
MLNFWPFNQLFGNQNQEENLEIIQYIKPIEIITETLKIRTPKVYLCIYTPCTLGAYHSFTEAEKIKYLCPDCFQPLRIV